MQISFREYVNLREFALNEVGAYGNMQDTSDVHVEGNHVYFKTIRVLDIEDINDNHLRPIQVSINDNFKDDAISDRNRVKFSLRPAPNRFKYDGKRDNMMYMSPSQDGEMVSTSGALDKVGIILKCLFAYIEKMKPEKITVKGLIYQIKSMKFMDDKEDGSNRLDSIFNTGLKLMLNNLKGYKLLTNGLIVNIAGFKSLSKDISYTPSDLSKPNNDKINQEKKARLDASRDFHRDTNAKFDDL